MELAFTKMHGLGNDMIVLDSLESGFAPSEEQARFLCDRRLGVGADQILVLLPSDSADFKMLIFNHDGSEVEMCGNGIRCLALYIHKRGISAKSKLTIETLAGPIKPEVLGETVRVDMGEPVFEASKVPVLGEGKQKDVTINVDDTAFQMSAVSMGNPHCVVLVDDLEQVPLERLGPLFERHPWFPNRTNTEFVQVAGRSRIEVLVWERGAGATLACGTGACAAAVAMMDLGLVDNEIEVGLPGGDLTIAWDENDNHVWMTGPAAFVYEGVVRL